GSGLLGQRGTIPVEAGRQARSERTVHEAAQARPLWAAVRADGLPDLVPCRGHKVPPRSCFRRERRQPEVALGAPLAWVWFLLLVHLSAEEEGITLDFCWLLGFVLLSLVYLVSGLGVLAAAVGAVCGWACAWLPRSLPLWLRRAALVASLHLVAALA